ncbi:MAG: TerB family tellurite resistance protein [Alphaproteobacteria bacterium]
MSIWGKIIGGTAGFAMGGPLGALFGVLAGHAVDRLSTQGELHETPDGPEIKQVAFTIAVVALGAKMAKADGVVTRDEVNAFKEVFKVPPEEARNVARFFDQAKKDSTGFEPYAKQVAGMFRDQPAVLEELLNCLFHIARADGVYHPEEKKFLRAVAEIFGFGEATFRRIEAENMGPDKADPYTVLGVSREDGDARIKAAYRTLIKEHHPDRLVAQGMPKEVVEMANEKLANINNAYDKIEKERGMK